MKMLKTKHFRRLAVFLAMIAPAVYLFGSLFSALTGSHGEQVFAEPVYVDEYVEVDSFVDDGSKYRFVIDGDLKTLFVDSDFHTWPFSFDAFGSSYDAVYCGAYSDYYFVKFGNRNDSYKYVSSTGVETFNDPLPWVLESDGFSFGFLSFFSSVGSLYKLMDVPSSHVPENAGAYSDYVFKNFFAKDNFLVEWGENAISENPRGFAPFGAFWRYLDINVLHLSNDQMGLMGYGYMYYACHVLLFDVGFILVTFFLDFIQKIADKFTGGE